MNYLITGTTGLIGSHILFELLHTQLTHPSNDRISLLVRSTKNRSSHDRISDILSSEDIPNYLKGYAHTTLMSKLDIIEGDLNADHLPKLLESHNSRKTIVIHSAASTNLFPGEAAENDVLTNNYNGTINLAKALPNCGRFVFISTAFCFGLQDISIEDDYFPVEDEAFRNSYERFKNNVEGWLVHHFSERLQIARPPIVCGRMIDTPVAVTSKFDVIYGWAKFFFKLKNKVEENGIRIHINFANKINILPVDYFVKVLLNFIETSTHRALNIVNRNPIPGIVLFGEILDILGVTNYEFIPEKPHNLNPIEKAYYNSVDLAFNPYLTNPNVTYNTSRLNAYERGLNQPDILKRLDMLFEFALDREFVDGYRLQEKEGALIQKYTSTESIKIRCSSNNSHSSR